MIRRNGPFRASSLRMPAARPIAPEAPSAYERVVSDLAEVIGDRQAAVKLVRSALAASGRSEVPEDESGFDSFVQADLVPALVARLSLDKIHTFVKRATLRRDRSGPRPITSAFAVTVATEAKTTEMAGKRVLLVERDGLRRATIARALVAEGLLVETTGDPGDALRAPSLDCLILAVDDGSSAIIGRLASLQTGARSRLGLVVIEDARFPGGFQRVAPLWPRERLQVVPAGASAAMVVSRVRAALG